MLLRLLACGFICLAATAAAGETVPVRVERLDAIAVFPEHSAPATVVSNGATDISAEIAARVVAFAPRVGDVIAAGGVIARLDCRDYEYALAAARAELDVLEARLELAERRLERARELRERNSLAAEVLDERESERAVAVAEIAGARARIAGDEVAVERCVIRSPFRALLRERLAPVGFYAAVGSPLARVVDIEDLELSAQVLTADVDAVAASEALEFVVDGRRFGVVLRTAVAAVNTETRNRELRLGFVDARPLVGSAGQLSWRDARRHVPGRVLVRREESLGLFLVAAGVARFVPLPAAQAGRAAPVTLDGDARVVVEGQFGLVDGQAVTLLDAP
ncbi:MAG: efflux RND transporter periplasmic adaptor subunit [Gammaproteobacteria bacterium]